MNYYRRYPGDYMRDTGHLSLTEHGAYTALLDHYYAKGAPLPASLDALSRLCRAMTTVEQDSVKAVADEFFPLADDGLRHNARADEEIAGWIEYQAEQSRKGKMGGRPKSVAKPEQSRGLATENPQSKPEAKPGESLPSPTPSPFLREEHPQPPQGGRAGLTANGGRKPREERDASLGAWRAMTAEIDRIASTAFFPAAQRLSWADIDAQDSAALRAAEIVGFRAIADRDKFTTSELGSRFREAYEQQRSRRPATATAAGESAVSARATFSLAHRYELR